MKSCTVGKKMTRKEGLKLSQKHRKENALKL